MHLLGAGGVEGAQVQGVVGGVDHPGQSALAQAETLEQFRTILGVQARRLLELHVLVHAACHVILDDVLVVVIPVCLGLLNLAMDD